MLWAVRCGQTQVYMQGRDLVGAIEGGGTKFICAVGESPAAILERVVVPTTDANATLGECLRFFRAAAGRHGTVRALGIGCFGPLQLRSDMPHFGSLLATPKAGWSQTSVLAPFREALGIPVVLDTDVGAAARAELELGAGRGQASLAYVTVGTGIGGAVAPGQPATRAMHAEMGHLTVRRDPRDVQFAGACPFHGDCLEGLASGPAILARWGCDLSSLAGDHTGRSIIAGYLGQLAAAIALLHAPQSLVIGGGVMSDESLLPLIREYTAARLGGYLEYLRDPASMGAFIRAPVLGKDSAIAGAMLMALEALPQTRAR
jgi:fructokinase